MRSFFVPSLLLGSLVACTSTESPAPEAPTTTTVTPAAKFHVGGTVAGLAGQGLALALNGASDPGEIGYLTSVGADGSFRFDAELESGQAYTVTVAVQPSGPTQKCSIAGGSGTIGSADVGSVAVTCATSAFSLGGTLSGLVDGSIVLDDGGEKLTVSANGAFAFSQPLASGASYAVSVDSLPPGQTCALAGGSGTVGAGDVADIAVTCMPNSYQLGGTVNGLKGTVVLHSSTGVDLPVESDGSFSFGGLPYGTAYEISVLDQPSAPHQTCTVTNGKGTIGVGDVSDIAVDCQTNGYVLSVNVSGLLGQGLVLTNGQEELPISADGLHAFATPLADETSYSVAVSVNPSSPDQLCTVENGDGMISGGDVADVNITCN